MPPGAPYSYVFCSCNLRQIYLQDEPDISHRKFQK